MLILLAFRPAMALPTHRDIRTTSDRLFERLLEVVCVLDPVAADPQDIRESVKLSRRNSPVLREKVENGEAVGPRYIN